MIVSSQLNTRLSDLNDRKYVGHYIHSTLLLMKVGGKKDTVEHTENIFSCVTITNAYLPYLWIPKDLIANLNIYCIFSFQFSNLETGETTKKKKDSFIN